MSATPNPLFAHLRDLHAHMAWADAVWFHLWGKSGFKDDPDLLQRVRDEAHRFAISFHRRTSPGWCWAPGSPAVPAG